MLEIHHFQFSPCIGTSCSAGHELLLSMPLETLSAQLELQLFKHISQVVAHAFLSRSNRPRQSHDPHCVQVIRLALQDAGVHPCDIAALEMHGTGTPLGDPIEVGAAATVLADAGSRQASNGVGLSAVKNVRGHSEPAAGAVGMHHAMSRYVRLSSRL